jgi:hypothetical protein
VLQNQYQTGRFNGEIVNFDSWADPPAGRHSIWDWIKKQKAESRYGIAKIEKDVSPVVVCEEQILGNLGHVHIAAIEKTSYTIFGKEKREDSIMVRKSSSTAPSYMRIFGYVLSCHKAQGGRMA